MTELRLVHEQEQSLLVRYGDQDLGRYVYRAPEAQLESPRPYWHPLYTLGGDLVSLYRPHDHVWHKGIAWSVANVSSAENIENFWGGATYLRDRGYVQLPNDGAMVHREFVQLAATAERIDLVERLDWVTESGRTWFGEQRRFTVTVAASGWSASGARGQAATNTERPAGAWILASTTQLTNVAGTELSLGSPTTHGRDNAGYGGLFWRGPRSFTGGAVHTPDVTGGDDRMGIRAPWLGFTGRHDGNGRSSTLVFVDAPDNPGHPTQWFVRSQPFACVCPAPFFSTEARVAPGGSVALRYAVVIADGDAGGDGAGKLAELGHAALRT